MRCFGSRRPKGGDSDTRSVLDVVVQHLPRIHPVDVISTEHEDVLRLFIVDQIEVLEQSVSRPREPLGATTHLRWHRGDVVAEHARQAPGPRDMDIE